MTSPEAALAGPERHATPSVAEWARLCRRLGARAASDELQVVGAELLGRWSEPHRRYHNRAHLASVLDALGTLTKGDRGQRQGQRKTGDANLDASGQPEVQRTRPLDVHDLAAAAAWYHDAVYDPTRSDNEEESSRLAAEQLAALDVDTGICDHVARLVLLTKSHRAGRDDHAGQRLCDADLSILTATTAVYDSYVAAVREEYGHLSDEEFRRGRISVLEDLARRPALFHTPYARRHWEAAARANVTRELRTIRAM